MPAPYISQSLNRFSYVHNNPINFNDPTGHMTCDEEGYCIENGVKVRNRAFDPLDRKIGLGNINKDVDDKGKNSREEHLPVVNFSGCEQDDYECLLWAAVDGEFDPYSAYIPSNGVNTDLAIYYNGLAYDAYSRSGYDLEMIAKLGINNPMTVYDFADADVPIEWIEMTSPGRRTPGQIFFIQSMRLDTDSVTNYEPNYLHAMMEAHPIELQLAKQNYYDALINVAGDEKAAYELWTLRDELTGPFDMD